MNVHGKHLYTNGGHSPKVYQRGFAFIPFLLANWQWIAVALVAVVVWGHGYHKGSQRLFEYQAEQAEARVAIVIKQGKVTEKVITNWRTVDRVIEKQGETIIREVPVYVTSQDDAACRIPDGFIRLWNRANAVPDASGRIDASPVRDSQP